MASRAAVSRVAWVAVEVGEASRLASDGEAGGIEGALEGRRAVGTEVLGALSDGASAGGADPHGEVVTVDKRDIIPVVNSVKGELSEGSGRNTSAGAVVANQSTVAASSQAGLSTGLAEVAVTPSPDPSSPPVVGDVEGDLGVGLGFPSVGVGRDSTSDVKVGEDSGPDGEGASVVHSEGTSGSTSSKGDDSSETGELHLVDRRGRAAEDAEEFKWLA